MGMSKFQALLSVLLGKKRTFPLYNSLKIVLFECPSDSLRVDWLGNDGIYELGCLDCIINMSRGDLAGNRVLVGFRELSWMTPFAVFLVKFNFLGNPINSTPAKTSFRGNFTMGIVKKEGNDVSMLLRSNGLHGAVGDVKTRLFMGVCIYQRSGGLCTQLPQQCHMI